MYSGYEQEEISDIDWNDSIDRFSENYTPVSKDGFINSDSELVSLIQLPYNKTFEHDYIGCIMGYGGTTINLIQKLTNTNIKIEHNFLNQHVKITPKSKFLSLSQKIINLNMAATIVTAIIKLKHTEYDKQSKFHILKEWQDNEKKIIVALNKELKKLNESKIDESFINRHALKASITKFMKESRDINQSHDSDKIPFIELFTKILKTEPKINDLTKKFTFKKKFKSYYDSLFQEYFQFNNIIVRGNLIIDDYLDINFRNFTSFFTEIHDYDEALFDMQSVHTKKNLENYIRPHSCTSLEPRKSSNMDSRQHCMFSPIPV